MDFIELERVEEQLLLHIHMNVRFAQLEEIVESRKKKAFGDWLYPDW